VISPEGCAAILWRDRAKAPEAARALKLTAQHLHELGVIDEIVPEPPGGAQEDYAAAAQALREALAYHLNDLEALEIDRLLEMRHRKFQSIGIYEQFPEAVGPPAPLRGRGGEHA
jgi:acetyl-CoA carboxylase carboxyl transferase subunit alpha